MRRIKQTVTKALMISFCVIVRNVLIENATKRTLAKKESYDPNIFPLQSAQIIYWQAKEIHRVIQTYTPPEHINLALLSNISPVSWKNVILYSDYILNRNKVTL